MLWVRCEMIRIKPSKNALWERRENIETVTAFIPEWCIPLIFDIYLTISIYHTFTEKSTFLLQLPIYYILLYSSLLQRIRDGFRAPAGFHAWTAGPSTRA